MASDSKKLRARLVSLFKRQVPDGTGRLAEYMDAELGTKFEQHGFDSSYLDWDALETGELGNLLDSITLVAEFLRGAKRVDPKRYIDQVNRIFNEESAAYRIDENAGGPSSNRLSLYSKLRVCRRRA